MEQRVITLELMVQQNTKMTERLDRSMTQLCQAVADLRVQMIQGQAELRQEIAHSHTQLHAFFERKFVWLISGYCGGLLTLIGFMAKYFLDSYAK